MAIDWLNPSDDVIQARQIGYDEGYEAALSENEALTADNEQLKAELENAQADASRLRNIGKKLLSVSRKIGDDFAILAYTLEELEAAVEKKTHEH